MGTMETIIVFLNTILHLFCFQQYGMYSLIVVVCGILYCLIICVYEAVHSDSSNPHIALWITLEILTITALCTVTFVINYSDERLYIISVICFVIYLFPNIPFSKLFMVDRFYHRTSEAG